MYLRLIIIVFFFIVIKATAQDKDVNLNLLFDNGFENLKSININTHYYLTYENNRYRFEGVALSKVLSSLQLKTTDEQVSILIQNKGIGISALHFSASNFAAFKLGDLSAEEFIESVIFTFDVDALTLIFEQLESYNPSFLKADFSVGIGLDYSLGDFTNSIRQKVNVQPQFSTIFGPGTAIIAQYNMPYFNEIDANNFNNLQLALLSQDMRFKKNQFLNLSLGYFTENQFGIYFAYNKFLYGERLRLNMDLGLTRRGYLDENFKVKTTYLQLNNTIKGGITYRWIKYNTDLAVQYGIYYPQDLGYKISYQRQMGERYIGLFMKKTTFGDMVGFNFRVPLGERKHLKPNRIRVRSKEYFDLEYNYSGADVAEVFFTGDNLLTQMTEYYPSVLKSSLKKMLR